MLATLIALVAIGARYVEIGIRKAGEKIKEGAIEAGKAVKSSYKDLIDKLPEVQRRENNFEKLISNLMEKNIEADKGERTMLSNEMKIIKMLQNQEQLAAIGQLIGEDKADLLNNLISKGGVMLLLFIHFFEQSTPTSNTHFSDYNIQFLIMFFYR